MLVPTLTLALSLLAEPGAAPTVSVVRLPNTGVQPQAAADSRGNVHVIYLVGEPGAADIEYARLTDTGFSKPIRVNSTPGSAVAIGSVRGPHLAIGRADRVHVAWNGSDKDAPATMYYSQMND